MYAFASLFYFIHIYETKHAGTKIRMNEMSQ